jgi:hypothetical protein
MPYPPPTTGLGVSARVEVDATTVTLSLSGTTTHQIVASVVDTALTPSPSPGGVSLVLTAAANASGGTTAYTGTITGGASNAFIDKTFVVAGFDNVLNNGTFICTASSTTVLTLDNGLGVADTHAATATEEGSSALTFTSLGTAYATVSASGLITAVANGNCTIEVGYPVFDNTLGNVPLGWPSEKISRGVYVHVTP